MSRPGVLLFLGLAIATATGESVLSGDPQDFVRVAVINEIQETENPRAYFRYTLHKQTSSGTATRDLCETKNGIVVRNLKWNERPLTPLERQKDDDKLNRWATSKEEQESRLRDQQAEQRRVLAIVRALPRGGRYTFVGTEKIRERSAVRLHFVPNPNFEPTTRETYIFRAAEGDLWIDSAEHRIVRLQAELMQNIDFGWGLLGHIRKGGTLQLEQTMVGRHAWRISLLNIDANGTALFFKDISIKQRQTAFDYRPVPATLTVPEAVALLRREPSDIPTKP